MNPTTNRPPTFDIEHWCEDTGELVFTLYSIPQDQLCQHTAGEYITVIKPCPPTR